MSKFSLHPNKRRIVILQSSLNQTIQVISTTRHVKTSRSPYPAASNSKTLPVETLHFMTFATTATFVVSAQDQKLCRYGTRKSVIRKTEFKYAMPLECYNELQRVVEISYKTQQLLHILGAPFR